MENHRSLCALIASLALAGSLAAQTPSNLVETKSSVESPCKPLEMQAAKDLTFHQRACFYGARLISPATVLHGAFVAGFAELRNPEHVRNEDLGEFGHRFADFYARRVGQNSAEMLVGYWHHEDPRARPAQAHGFLNRTRAAFASVLVVKGDDGRYSPALAPIAGSLGSGLMSMGFYQKNNTFSDAMQRSGFAYSTYFATALAREFQPDLAGFVSRLRHRKEQN